MKTKLDIESKLQTQSKILFGGLKFLNPLRVGGYDLNGLRITMREPQFQTKVGFVTYNSVSEPEFQFGYVLPGLKGVPDSNPFKEYIIPFQIMALQGFQEDDKPRYHS